MQMRYLIWQKDKSDNWCVYFMNLFNMYNIILFIELSLQSFCTLAFSKSKRNLIPIKNNIFTIVHTYI